MSMTSANLAEDALKKALAIAAHRIWNIATSYVKCAFMSASLPPGKERHIAISTGYSKSQHGWTKIMVLRKNINGTCEGAMLWLRSSSKTLISDFGRQKST